MPIFVVELEEGGGGGLRVEEAIVWDVSLCKYIQYVWFVRFFFHMLSLPVLACIRSMQSIGIACLRLHERILLVRCVG